MDIKQQFEEALNDFIEKVKEDRNILAVILFGSLSYDTVWEKSDIDLMLITRDMKPTGRNAEQRDGFALTERDINIHAILMSRSEFKKTIEGSLDSSFIHSSFSKSSLMYTYDESIKDLYNTAMELGSRDRQVQLFRAGALALPMLYKAEKFLFHKNDPQYSFLWITYMYSWLAQIETYTHHQIAGREVIHQALALNPDFFHEIYTNLLNVEKTTPTITAVLVSIDRYLSEKIPLLFQPLLDYLQQEGRIVSITEISHWLNTEMNINNGMIVCEWLVDKGIIHKASSPVRLTQKSLIELEELAFYYEN